MRRHGEEEGIYEYINAEDVTDRPALKVVVGRGPLT